jgi:hypothetical protein
MATKKTSSILAGLQKENQWNESADTGKAKSPAGRKPSKVTREKITIAMQEEHIATAKVLGALHKASAAETRELALELLEAACQGKKGIPLPEIVKDAKVKLKS